MKLRLITTGICLAFCLLTITNGYSLKSAPLSPVDQGSWIIGAGVGPGTDIFGNGRGLGVGIKFYFENGTWQLGPGVLTLGGDLGFSIFSNRFLGEYRETWNNVMFGARSAYHYGWNVPGLDTYGGIPLGIGFSFYHHGRLYTGYQPIYPYLGFFVGTSYFFNKIIGVNGEFGYNVTYANIGVIVKLH